MQLSDELLWKGLLVYIFHCNSCITYQTFWKSFGNSYYRTLFCGTRIANDNQMKKTSRCFKQKEQAIVHVLTWHTPNTYFTSLQILTAKSTIKWKSSAYRKYKYEHLSCCYNKSTLYKRFLNVNKIFEKISNYWQNLVICDGPFWSHHCMMRLQS